MDTISVGNSPTELVLNSDKHLLYVTNSGNHTVSIINTNDNSIVKTWVTYTNVVDVLFDSLTNQVYTLTSHEVGETVSIRNAMMVHHSEKLNSIILVKPYLTRKTIYFMSLVQKITLLLSSTLQTILLWIQS